MTVLNILLVLNPPMLHFSACGYQDVTPAKKRKQAERSYAASEVAMNTETVPWCADRLSFLVRAEDKEQRRSC